MRQKITLKEGQLFDGMVNKPAIFINGKGKNCYIWIGNDAESDKRCYATLSGMKTLEKLAANIYIALGHKPMFFKPKKITHDRTKIK